MSDQPSPAKRRRLGRHPELLALDTLSTTPTSRTTTSGSSQTPTPNLTRTSRSSVTLDKLPDGITVDQTMRNLLQWEKQLQAGLCLRDEEPVAQVPRVTDIDVPDAPSSLQPSTPGAAETNVTDQLTSDEDATTALPVWNWEDAPIHQGRDYVVVHVSKSTAKRKPKHEDPFSIKIRRTVSVEVWSISVQDKSRPDSHIFEVYGKDSKYQNLKDRNTVGKSIPGGTLDLSICEDEKDARGLGAYVCNLMNRMPFELSEAVWKKNSHQIDGQPQLGLIRRLIQALALDSWLTPFDRLRLPEDHQDLRLGISLSTSQDSFDDVSISTSVRYLSTTVTVGYAVVRVAIQYSRLDVDKVKALPDVPATFMYKYAPVGGATTDNQRLLLKAFHIIQYNLSFKVGSKGGIMQHLDRELAEIYRESHVVGPKKPKNKTSGVKTSKSKVGKNIWGLLYTNNSVSVTPATHTKRVCTGKLPVISIRSTSGTMVAHVLNRMLAMQIRKRDVLNVWQAGMLEGDLVSNGRVTQDDVKQGYCSCEDSLEQSQMKHICMICLKSFLCNELLRTPDGRRVCESHTQDAFEMHNDQSVASSLKARLGRIISSARNRAKKDMSPDRVPSTEAFKKKLLPSILDSKTWLDWYFGQLSTRDMLSGASPASHARTYPAQMSLDAIHNIFIIDGQLVQHHPDNSALTALCLNHLKGPWGASIFSVIGAAATQTLKEFNGAVRDEAFWADFDNATDRLHRISFQVTTLASMRRRLAPDDIDAELMRVHLEPLRTSLWNPGQSSPIVRYKIHPPRTLGEAGLNDMEAQAQALFAQRPTRLSELGSKASMPIYLPWENKDKKRLTKVLKEMQADPLINPKRLNIVWSATGAPWFFREAHMFTEDDDLWDWVFEECHARLARMWYLCNVRHDTIDSPDTVLLEIAVQWFRNGGTYDYIHCEMTVFQRHPLCLSLGRSGKVEPGSPLMTGWTVSRPSSLDHYDMNRSTIAVQPLCINQFWSDYNPELHSLMFEMLCNLPKQTAYYGEFLRSTSKVEYPKESRVSRRRRRSMIEDDGIEDSEDEDLHAEMLAQGLTDDEEQSDAESDAESDAGEPGDSAAHEVVEYLQGTLEVLVEEIADRDPDFLSTQQCQERLRKLRHIADSRAEDSFWELHTDLVDIVQSRIDGVSGKQTDKCCECSQDAVAGMMLRCANPAHIDAIFHFTCVEGLTAMPAGDSMALCPGCKRDQSKKDSGVPTSRHRNMVNLGATCYMSSSVQILRHIMSVLNIPFDSKSLLAKPDAQSGRIPKDWLPGCYKFRPETPDAKISEMSSQHMSNAKALYEALITLSDHLGTPGLSSYSETLQFFKRVNAINPSDWKQHEMNDSVALFNTLVEYMLLATDDSVPSGRGRLTKLISAQHQADQPMPLLADDSFSQYTAYVGEGRTSLLTGNVYVQFVKEYECDCSAISRSFEQGPKLDLDLPPVGAHADKFGLIKMLEDFVSDRTDIESDLARRCSACETRSVRMLYRKITISPQVLVISFKRFAGARLEHVDLPEYLDLSPYADGARLPSDPQSGNVKFQQQPIYRLIAINMYVPTIRHYVSYILVDGTWLKFDDMAMQPTPCHPQAAILEGHIPYYTVYQQLKGKTALPVDSSGQPAKFYIFTKDNAAPAAKVADLYETTSTSPTDDGFHNPGDAPGGSPGGPPVLNCPNCDYHTSHQEEFDQHMSSNHTTMLTCPKCDKFQAASQDELDRHMSSVHTTTSDHMQAEFSCGQCEQVFKDHAARDVHQQQAHSTGGSATIIQGVATGAELPVMQMLRQIQQQQIDMQAALQRQNQQHQTDLQTAVQRQIQQHQTDLQTALQRQNLQHQTDLQTAVQRQIQQHQTALQGQNQQHQADLQTALQGQNEQHQTNLQTALQRQNEQYQTDLQTALQRQHEQHRTDMQTALQHQAQQQQSFEGTALKRRELERLQAARAQDEDRSRDLMARSEEMMATGGTLKDRASELHTRSQQITAREQELQDELGPE